MTLRALVQICCVVTMTLAPVNFVYSADYSLPELGDGSTQVLSRGSASELGKEFYTYLQGQNLVLDDPLVVRLLRRIGEQLAAGADVEESFTFFAVADRTPNAFAVPGGYIGVHVGLLGAMRTEQELAAVLAHEIAHIEQHHIERMYQRTSDSQLPTAVALLAAILIGIQAPNAGGAGIYTAIAAAYQDQITFTRENEIEADSVGIRILSAAGYDPDAMAQTFVDLAQTRTYQADDVPEFLRSHPVTRERIAAAQGRALAVLKNRAASRRTNDTPEYQFVVGYLAGRYPDLLSLSELPLDREEARGTRTLGLRYGNWVMSERDPKAVPTNQGKLKSVAPDIGPAYWLVRGMFAQRDGDQHIADRVYRNAMDVYPSNIPLTLDFTAFLARTGRNTDALALADKTIRDGAASGELLKFGVKIAHQERRDSAAYLYGAMAAIREHKTQEARSLATKGLRLAAPNSSVANRLSAVYRLAAGNLDPETRKVPPH